MDILLISNGVYEYDGRLKELTKVLKGIGRVTLFTRVDSSKNYGTFHFTMNKNKRFNFIRFIVKAIIVALKMKNVDILFIDNRKAIIPGLIINGIKKPKIIIQDARELYLKEEVNHIGGKIGCYFEKLLIEKTNILICANSYRAEIMKRYYSLSEMPLVYENIRELQYDKACDLPKLSQMYKELTGNNTFKIISTSGYCINRLSDKIVLAMKELGERFELLLVGGGDADDRNRIMEIIKTHNIRNVHLVGKVGENELKYLIKQCHVGVVSYHRKDTNNRYCASGKIYEFIFEGLPVITTENIPLLRIIKKNHIGIADDNFSRGICVVYHNYLYYKDKVQLFSKSISAKANNQQLIELIKNRLPANMDH